MANKLNRIDYTQVGLTSKNSFKLIKQGIVNSGNGNVAAVVGDHSGSVHCFILRSDSTNIETIFKTLPGPNAKISCIEVINSTNSGGSPKFLVAFGSALIRGYTKKGKQFFGLELNNLTEPIKNFKIRWPNEIFITGHYIYNNYIITETDSKTGSMVESKNYYVCPEKINELILIEDKHNRKVVPVLACQDRLLRIVKDSSCQYEIEICGIPSALLWMHYLSNGINETLVCYGTLDGKVALVSIEFTKKPLEPLHKWEIPEKGSKSSVTCLAIAESVAELYIGRSDGNIEIWSFTETLSESGEEMIDLSLAPIFRDQYNCGESLTTILVANNGNLILCSTFTGVIFGLTRNEMINQKLNPNYLLISKDTALKIESLREDCERLEQKLADERERYQEMTSKGPSDDVDDVDVGVSALPYFAINDSFILQEDASYLLTLEVEIAIDAVIIQSDIPLDLIDCERNSAVISFNDNNSKEVLVTFRCQANTTRLEIKIRSIEGQYGLLRAYVMTRVSPKCAQMKTYSIKPLSLHKRSYTAIDTQFMSKLTISGNFSLNESHVWLQLCIPEIPEKITSTSSSPVINYNFVSTFTETIMICSCGKGVMTFQSDNISTISIIKDFITREATKRSTAIEMTFDVNEASVGHTLKKLYPKLKNLINIRHNKELIEAVNEMSVSDPQIAHELMAKLMISEDMEKSAAINLERIYGIIADLFIDYHKLKGGSRSVLSGIRSRINELVSLIETYATEDYGEDMFVDKLNQFWGLQIFV